MQGALRDPAGFPAPEFFQEIAFISCERRDVIDNAAPPGAPLEFVQRQRRRLYFRRALFSTHLIDLNGAGLDAAGGASRSKSNSRSNRANEISACSWTL